MVGKSGFPMGLAAIGLVLGATVTATAADNTLDLAPAADTFVEGGTQATWDHGLADHLTVDHSPADVTYLKFDLSAAAAPAPPPPPPPSPPPRPPPARHGHPRA